MRPFSWLWKIEKASEVAKEAVALAKHNGEAIEDLELKVEATEVGLREEIRETEERVLKAVEDRVKGMVDDQLRAAGFDQDLSAGDLTVRSSVQQSTSYAGILSKTGLSGKGSTVTTTVVAKDRREEKFWKTRRSLRMWPVARVEREGVVDFLCNKLKMSSDFIEEELGDITVAKCRDPRSKVKDEVLVVFETKQVRDAVKAKAANLANFGQEAGMRLEVPNHLQKSFRMLMNLAFDMKQKNPDLRRNIKFDEEELSLFMETSN